MKLKKNNKKGFTIVELVIVIAVIAILAAVLIPTFSGLVEKANQNSAMQAARNAYTEYLLTADNAENMDAADDYVIISGNYAFVVENGSFNATATKIATGATVTIYNGATAQTVAVATTTPVLENVIAESATATVGNVTLWKATYSD